jgi:hypothetical protein
VCAFCKLMCLWWFPFYNQDDLIDESDPDTDLPQIVHAMQTAEVNSTKSIIVVVSFLFSFK